MRVVKYWNRLPRLVVNTPFLRTLKVPLSNLMWMEMSLCIARVFNWATFKCPFQSKVLYDSMTVIIFFK